MIKYLITGFAMAAAVWSTVIPTSTVERAAARGFLLLQKSGYKFTNGRPEKCASCHHNTLTAMVAELAATKGIASIDSLKTDRIQSMCRVIRFGANPNLQNTFVQANFIAPYMLLGLHASGYTADPYTDMACDFVMSQALPDGRWVTESGRPPLETGEIHLIAFSIRAIRLYAPPAKRAQVDAIVARSRRYLEKADPDGQQELVFQLLGLHWSDGDPARVAAVAKKLRSLQRPDGGWSQLPTLGSDAYATGQALFALAETGMCAPDEPCYQQGLNYLLKTQDESGGWAVDTRAYPIQPFANSDFPPYDENQFISAAGSNWAVIAMLKALPDRKTD